ncbi:hypothetical protein [Sedimentimonas flavescens]|uniref:hypothetical protein n=1 Tax=Sedimentimonas flavescens TaxID=2851012 RepID=UPI001C49EA0A|nr:hypothetical protein [Sedimentimonas flavescens]MBW0157968.1 hypothetical protein [Sedimentimonas flavescens]
MIRPELRATLTRHAETAVALAATALGLWIASRGGYILIPFGLAMAAVCLGWAALAFRRARFARPVSNPGLVDLDEGRIGYYGAGQGLGGYVALEDLTEIRLLNLSGTQYWRLKSSDGQAIMIPTAAAGGEKLYDAFATLPGIDMGALTVALDRRIAAQSLWTRPATH